MTRIVIDCETQGLNTRRFLVGVLCHENYECEYFNTPKKMYDRIIELSEIERHKNKSLDVYAHSLEYDYLAVGAFDDKRNVPFCPYPLIVDHYVEGERGDLVSSIKWIDSLGFWRGSLESLGEAIEEPKGHMPEWLKLDAYEPSFIEMNEITQYCKQDCIVLMRFINNLKKKLWDEGIRPKKLITTPQVAISYFMKRLRLHEYDIQGNPHEEYDVDKGRYVKKGDYLEDIDGCAFYATQYSPEILESYRLGRVQAFKTGHHPSVNLDDINSLFPYAATQMEYPKLNSEKKINEPLKLYTPETLFNRFGISRCIMKTPEREHLGYLAVRQYKTREESGHNEYTHYPETNNGEQHLLYGTWTHLELKRALELGYTVEHVSWSVVWDTIPNPMGNIIERLYHLRKDSGTAFDNTFYKLILNSIFGKLAQRRPHKELIKIDREDLPAFREEGWEPVYEWGTDVLVQKAYGIDYKRYYAPIIATYVTAWSRDYLYTHLQQIPRDMLWYCATDSIVYDSIYSNSYTFKYGEDLGQWKREYTGEELLVYGRQSYCIGEDVRLSRIPKQYVTKENFYTGIIPYKDIVRMNKSSDPDLIGTAVEHTRELSYEEHEEIPYLLIDTRITLDDAELETLKTILE